MPTLDHYISLLSAVADAESDKPLKQLPLTVFAGRTGSRYVGGLMVVGRAVNGWRHEVKRIDLTDADRLQAVAACEVSSTKPSREPMRWVDDLWGNRDGYNTARSAFWRVIRDVADRLDVGGEGPWSSHVAWSNLYRVAPARGGNPNARLKDVQLSTCQALLAAEVEAWRPRRLLFLTGRWWADPFMSSLGIDLDGGTGKYVEGAARSGACAVVVAPHPQAKPHAAVVNDIVSGFRALR